MTTNTDHHVKHTRRKSQFFSTRTHPDPSYSSHPTLSIEARRTKQPLMFSFGVWKFILISCAEQQERASNQLSLYSEQQTLKETPGQKELFIDHFHISLHWLTNPGSSNWCYTVAPITLTNSTFEDTPTTRENDRRIKLHSPNRDVQRISKQSPKLANPFPTLRNPTFTAANLFCSLRSKGRNPVSWSYITWQRNVFKEVIWRCWWIVECKCWVASWAQYDLVDALLVFRTSVGIQCVGNWLGRLFRGNADSHVRTVIPSGNRS